MLPLNSHFLVTAKEASHQGVALAAWSKLSSANLREKRERSANFCLMCIYGISYECIEGRAGKELRMCLPTLLPSSSCE